MNYTLQNISTASSYEALKRNGFSDLDVVAYYGTPKEHRGTMFIQIKAEAQRKKFGAPKPKVNIYTPTEKLGAQKCTGNPSFAEVDAKFREYMNTDFVVNGKTFNATKLGYSMKWNNNKTRFGVHKLSWINTFLGGKEYTNMSIELSRYMFDNAHKNLADWTNTILHEIAHAIDYDIRGKSNHDGHWVRVAKAIGCSGERCGTYKVESKHKWLGSCSCKSTWKRHKLTRSSRHGNCGSCRSSIEWKQQF
jgi:predicted SprT family Zn-dependent metalloprotease